MVFGSYCVTKKLLISIDTLHLSIIRAEIDISLHGILAKRKKDSNSNGIGKCIHAGPIWGCHPSNGGKRSKTFDKYFILNMTANKHGLV